jgi:hypothetical protein
LFKWYHFIYYLFLNYFKIHLRQPKLIIMKTFFFATLFALCTFTSFSQSSSDPGEVKFGVGPALSIPTGILKQGANYGLGIEGTAVYTATANIQAFAQVGIHVFQGPTDPYSGDNSSYLHIPLIVGARFTTNNFFAGAGIGYGLWSGGDGGSSASGFLYSPQVGYDFGQYQLLANYTATSSSAGTFSYFGLKGYYIF